MHPPFGVSLMAPRPGKLREWRQSHFVNTCILYGCMYGIFYLPLGASALTLSDRSNFSITVGSQLGSTLAPLALVSTNSTRENGTTHMTDWVTTTEVGPSSSSHLFFTQGATTQELMNLNSSLSTRETRSTDVATAPDLAAAAGNIFANVTLSPSISFASSTTAEAKLSSASPSDAVSNSAWFQTTKIVFNSSLTTAGRNMSGNILVISNATTGTSTEVMPTTEYRGNITDMSGGSTAGCVNDDGTEDQLGGTCTVWYDEFPADCGNYDDSDFEALKQCCACKQGAGSNGGMETEAPSEGLGSTPGASTSDSGSSSWIVEIFQDNILFIAIFGSTCLVATCVFSFHVCNWRVIKISKADVVDAPHEESGIEIDQIADLTAIDPDKDDFF